MAFNVLEGMNYIQQQGDKGRAQGKENRLAQLSQQAYGQSGADRQSSLAQMEGTTMGAGHAAGAKFRQMDQDAAADLSRKAAQFVALAEMGDEAAIQAAYPEFAAQAASVTGYPIPPTYDPKFLGGIQKLAGAAQGSNVQSTYIDAQGNRVAIMRDGTTAVLGQNAPNNQIIDTGAGFYGVNKGNLQAVPVTTGGAQPQQGAPQPQRAPGEVPFTIDPSLPPQVQASIRANESRWANAPEGGQMNIQQPQGAPQMGGQLRSTPKPQAAPAGYRINPDGSMSAIPGGPAQIAQDARADAAAAKKAAEGIKAEAKQRAEASRQTEASTAANHLISQIDGLIQHPGFDDLGTAWGDTKIATPLIRNDAKDAHSKLQNIAGQVALATMARLKSLSSTGATGFGSLTKPELTLLQNSIDTLQSEDISNAQLKESLGNIRKFMEKTAGWSPSPQGQQAAPDDEDDALIGKYL